MKFMDPRIDFAFKKIFGSEDAKDILISFLESLLGLEGERRLAEVTILDPFLAPKIRELKYSILDVKCRDQRGISYIVEMQVQKVAAFLKRIQFNAAQAYVQQIERGEEYPKLNQVIAITITDFILFNRFDHCVSRHESRETVTGDSFLQEIVHYFIELPKFTRSPEALSDTLEQWIYFIKWAGSLTEVPERISSGPIRHAFEKAMVAHMSHEELELYEKAGIAITDARGAVELAREEGEAKGRAEGEAKGKAEGRAEGKAEGRQEGETALLLRLLHRRFGPLPTEIEARIRAADSSGLAAWSDRLWEAHGLAEIFADEASR